MFRSQQKSTGTEYTGTVALLAVAFVFSPAVLILSSAPGYYASLSALVCSGLCTGLAWLQWKKFSNLTIPSIETMNARTK